MIILLSPAKSLDFEKPALVKDFTLPMFEADAVEINKTLRDIDVNGLIQLMSISKELAELNYHRNQIFSIAKESRKQALFAFVGEAYRGLDAYSFSADDVAFAQQHLRILSGLYGVLKPLDIISPYRLEMGIPLKTHQHKNLYSFWTDKVTEELKKSSDVIVNLASVEYSKVVNLKQFKQVITPIFKEYSPKDDSYKVISVYAKRARGLMSAFIIKNRITKPEEILHFNSEGYGFSEQLSAKGEWVFVR